MPTDYIRQRHPELFDRAAPVRRGARPNTNTKYYIYALSIPKGGGVFYIGKGTGMRVHQHWKDAESGARSIKAAVIRYCQQKFNHYEYDIVATTDDEAEAYWLEMKHITSYPLGYLTNVMGPYRSNLLDLRGVVTDIKKLGHCDLELFDFLVVDGFFERRRAVKTEA